MSDPPLVVSDPPTPMEYLKLLFPQYFDPTNPAYVEPPEKIDIMLDLAEEARPLCLSEKMQNYAQALFAGYLLDVQSKLESGDTTTTSGIVTSEREGDIAVTYADPTAQAGTGSRAPPASAWDQWQSLWKRCTRGAITTRYGDPSCPAQPSASLIRTRALSALRWRLLA